MLALGTSFGPLWGILGPNRESLGPRICPNRIQRYLGHLSTDLSKRGVISMFYHVNKFI